MRPEHMIEMDTLLAAWEEVHADVLDVGSCDVNGTFMPLVENRGWAYVGLDIVDGPNVDVVSADAYRYPFERETFDIVISGSTMEHVEAVWLWVAELARLLRPGGMLALITHTSYAFHPHPVDCWRVMPDGMRFLFDRTGVLQDYRIEMFSEHDISGLAWKVEA